MQMPALVDRERAGQIADDEIMMQQLALVFTRLDGAVEAVLGDGEINLCVGLRG